MDILKALILLIKWEFPYEQRQICDVHINELWWREQTNLTDPLSPSSLCLYLQPVLCIQAAEQLAPGQEIWFQNKEQILGWNIVTNKTK